MYIASLDLRGAIALRLLEDRLGRQESALKRPTKELRLAPGIA